MLFDLINKAQLMLSELHQRSQETLANENKLYEEMLKEQQRKLEILEKERENQAKETEKLKEIEKKKREEYLDLMKMDEDKENKLRMQWLKERENEESDEKEENSATFVKKSMAEIVISEKDLLIVNLLKNLSMIFAKIIGININEFSNLAFKELKKMSFIENNEVFKLFERKSSEKYEKLLTEKFGKFREILSKSTEKDSKFVENLLFSNFSENSFEEILGKKMDFYLDVTHNPSSSFLSKTVSLDRTIEDSKNTEKSSQNEKKSQKDKISQNEKSSPNEKNLQNEKNSQNEKSSKNNKNSRYLMDFEEIANIGKGSFGEVIKAKNRIDGRYYAIKKIKIYQGRFLNRIMREVQTLSLMHHQYVLRYYQAWIEEVETEAENLVLLNF